PAPDARLAYPAAMRHYARAVAYAELHDRAGFDLEIAAMAQIGSSGALEDMIAQGVPADELIGLATRVASGRFALLGGRTEDAIGFYREATAIEGRLPYQEPTYWYYPVRQSLGAALFQARRYSEA